MDIQGFPIKSGQIYQHSRSGNYYEIVGISIDATHNDDDLVPWVIYKDYKSESGVLYKRTIQDFLTFIKLIDSDRHATVLRFGLVDEVKSKTLGDIV